PGRADRAPQITGTSRPTRCYWIRQREDLDPTTCWLDSGLGGQSPDEGPTTTRTVPGEASDMRFFRIEVVQPLSDNTPPPVPGGLRVVQLGPTHNRASLAWDSVEDTGGSGLKEYILRRNDLEVVRPVLPFGVDAFLLPDREYSFSVAAVDMAGNVSAFSAPLVVHSLALVPV